MKKIAIDAMGGENAPKAIIDAVLKAKPKLKDIEFILFGDAEKINQLIPNEQKERIEVVATSEVTGALLACGIFIIGRIKGVERPALMPTLPSAKSEQGFNIIDVGANAQSKPEYLVQWAQMANFYAQKVRNIQNPTVALLNNGAEDDKGDPLHQEAYKLLKETKLNFIGNVEGNDLMEGKADVIVTDGFTGNATLKAIEGTASVILRLLKDSLLNNGLRPKVGALLAKPGLTALKKRFDTARYGGAVLLGVNAPVVKTHGRSNIRPIYYTLLQIDKMLSQDLVGEYKKYFSESR